MNPAGEVQGLANLFGATDMLGAEVVLAEQAEQVEVCRSFRNNAQCRFGDDCRFEHSEGEPILVSTAPRDRGECFNWRDSGDCVHGDQCRFSHGAEDSRTGDLAEEICRNYLRGRCNNDPCPRRHEGTPQMSAPRREFAPRRERQPRRGVCYDFRDGNCDRDECRFSHEVGGESSQPRYNQRPARGRGVCYDFRDGNCDRGEECRFAHGEENVPNAQSNRGGGRRGGPGICHDFRDGNCDRDYCRFSHGDDDAEQAPYVDGGYVGGGGGGGRPKGVCYDFQDGVCDRADECRFSHEAGAGDGGPRIRRERTKLDEICNNFQAGRCRQGDRCRRIHA